MKRAAPWPFLAPATLHLFVFGLMPLVFALWASLHDWKILKGSMPFVGFAKYSEVLSDPTFWNALGNSIKFTLLSLPAGLIVSLGVAMVVARPLRGMAFFRTLYYVPAVCSMVAVSMLWIYIYLPENGLINATLALFRIKGVDFLNHPSWAMPALAFMSIWTGLGPRMIVYVAGLLGVPPSLYEAAELDGAGGWTKFRRITWPSLAPTNLFVIVTGTIASFQLFTPVYMMTKGGPLETTDVLAYHIYVEAWRKFHVSTASAQSLLLLGVIGLFAWIQWRLMRSNLEAHAAG